jgi:hypothetical protein
MPWLPRQKFNDWPKDAVDLPREEIQRLYEADFAGAKHDAASSEAFAAKFPKSAEDLAHQYGLAESGAGKLSIPFVFILEMFPGCLPGPAQVVGDCVSHSEKNAVLQTMCCDIVSEQPDEKTGIYEGVPEVSPEGIANGVLSTEAIYWHRGYSGHGWFCSAAAETVVKKSGFVLRQNYHDLGFDLTQYSNRNISLYGANAPSEKVLAVTKQHLVHDMAEASTAEAIRDFLANGYGVASCGSEGFSNERDQYGVSEKTKSWAHAIGVMGVDDRDVIKQLVGEPLYLFQNSWNIWNGGPRDIYQSAGLVPADKKELWIRCGIVNPSTGNIMIPEGSFWAKWSRVKNREYFVHSGGVGFPRKKLPDLGTYIWG